MDKDNLNILFFTDVHGNIDAIKRLDFKKYDLVICGGDIIDPTFPDINNAKKVISLLPKETYIVPGNCDKGVEIGKLIDTLTNIHKKHINIDGIDIVGIGYSGSLKDDLIFYRKWFTDDEERIFTYMKESQNTFILDACGIKVGKNNKISMIPIDDALTKMKGLIDKFDFFVDEELKELTDNIVETNFSIVITHSPPHGLLDRLPGLPNIGSVSITNLIKKIKPRLVLCGHFHENVGTATFLDKTIVFNPGAIKDNSYGEITIKDGKIETKVVKV